MQVRFDTEKAVGYFILVPEETKRIHVDWKFVILDMLTPNQKMIPIEEGEFTHLGTLGKLTEEQAAGIVDAARRICIFWRKADSLEVYTVNPLGERRPLTINPYDFDKWQAAEARTGRWEIIFKLK